MQPVTPLELDVVRRAARYALAELRPNDAAAAWASAPPQFFPTPDGIRWDVRLGPTWSRNGTGAQKLREALGDDFGRELLDTYADFRLPPRGGELLVAAGETRKLRTPCYTSADIDRAATDDDARYSLLVGRVLRTVQRLRVMAMRQKVVVAARPFSVAEAVLQCESVVNGPTTVFTFPFVEVSALAAIEPEMAITVHAEPAS